MTLKTKQKKIDDIYYIEATEQEYEKIKKEIANDSKN